MKRLGLRIGAAVGMVVAIANALVALPARSQPSKDTLVMGMQLEPTPGLDPTGGAASAIGEVTLYNIFETLTKINEDGSVSPLLAQSWIASPDLRRYAFKLRHGVQFQNGEPFNSGAVKFSFERAAAAGSVNKDKATFSNIEDIAAPDDSTLVLTLRHANADLPFQLGQATAVIVEPKSAAANATHPVGTGPYRLKKWSKGTSVVLERWEGYRSVAAIKLRQVTIRFIGDASAQTAALLAGDVDSFPRTAVSRALARFSSDKNFQVLVGHSRTKTILAMNNKRPPLNDVRVRRAIYAAIDRRAVIDGSIDGFGVPIGSFYAPAAPGYVDATGINPHDPLKARALLNEAGVQLPLKLSLKVPPVSYAQRGAEVVAGQLVQVGIVVKVETVEWAQWIASVYGQRAYDLTLIAHVEPLDFGNFARQDYYWGYESVVFNDLWARIATTGNAMRRNQLLADAQRLVATDAVAAYLYHPNVVTVANWRLRGLWKHMPIAVNDLSALSW
jgi:peptide/nickel transport system substrate-binding protein